VYRDIRFQNKETSEALRSSATETAWAAFKSHTDTMEKTGQMMSLAQFGL